MTDEAEFDSAAEIAPTLAAKNKGGRPRGSRSHAGAKPASSAAAPPRAGTALSAEDIAAIAAQVAQVMLAAGKPSMVVPPDRVGATPAPVDEDESYDPLSPSVQRQAREKLNGGRNVVPRAQGLSDEDVLAMFQEEESGEFEVPNEIKVDGMAYGWKLKSALGKEDSGYEAELRRRQWVNVNYENHPGAFGPKGESGPIVRKGLQLMRRPIEMEELRQRYWRLTAKQAVRDKIAQMASAPPGTAPRTHRDVAPRINRTYEPLPVE